MKLIVTGGCGFVGFNLVKHFLAAGHDVTAMDNLARRGSETNVSDCLKMGVRFVHGDIRSVEDLTQLPSDADCLIECSAQPSVVSGYANPLYDFTTNVTGVINCLEFCRARGTGMIFLSSSRVYPACRINALPRLELDSRWDWDPDAPPESVPAGFDPVNGISAAFPMDGPTKTLYGASKAAADFFCQEYADAFGLPIAINRCGVIAGKGQFGVATQGWLTFWAISCLLERPLTYLGFKGKQVRDILFIEDLCSLLDIQLARLESNTGKVWNVGGGRQSSLSLIEATELMERLMGKKMTTHYRDDIRKADMVIYITDNAEVARDLAWSPRESLEGGAFKIARWVQDNRAKLASAGL
jgi:CDP-paratose 2-epimerase